MGLTIEQFNKLSDTEQVKVIYQEAVDKFFDETRNEGVSFIDSCEEAQLINDYETQSSRREVVLGIMLASAKMLESSAAAQARHELQSQTEHSQFGVEVANRISDLSAEMMLLVEELITNSCHYQAILTGRQALNVHYTDAEGTAVRDERQEAESGPLE